MKLFFLKLSIVFLLAGIFSGQVIAKKYWLKSPDGNLKVQVVVNDSVTYQVYYKGREIIMPSAISMVLQTRVLGTGAMVKAAKQTTVNDVLTPLNNKVSKLNDKFNQLQITFNSNYSLIFRAYDEGIAYRFLTDIADSVKVISERADFNVSGTPQVIFPETDTYTSWEVAYQKYDSPALIKEGKKAITPVMFSYPQTNIKVAVAEADLLDYPGMYLTKKDGRLTGNWAAYPARTELGSWGNFVSVVKERAPYIALTNGKREFPWRIIIATDDDRALLTNQLVYKLARPSVLTNTNWIKPGKAAWEWWNDALLPGAKIASGMDNRSTELYKYYVDFAAANKLEYMMVDAGWSNVYDIKKPNPKVDIRDIIDHATSKHVGVFVWCVATSLMNDLDGNLDYLKSLGAAGVKIDFFDRDDQLAIQLFEKIAMAAAKRKLMVDFHGCSKPTGLQKTYPNIINYESVRGEECDKWDYTANPDQHLLIPFIRMLAGPLDYTPGGMRNKSKEKYKPIGAGLPSSEGTRCHELALFVLFDQPLGVLADSPAEYMKYPDCMSFLSAVPTVFDDTRVLDAKLGEYALIAKRKQNNWFIGAISNWDQRELKLNFAFLPEGKTYQADVYTDATDANENAEHYVHKTITISNHTKTNLTLAKGGGAVIYIHQ